MIPVFVNQWMRQRACFIYKINNQICRFERRHYGLGLKYDYSQYNDGASCQNYSTNSSYSSPHVFFDGRKAKFIKRLKQLSSKQPVISKTKSIAGVLIPFCIAKGKPSVFLTKRSHKLTRNKGDVSFPGGKMDAADKDIVDTALRETYEETGLLRSDIQIWASLKPMSITDPDLTVVPVIGFIQNLEISKLRIDSNEVLSVFTVSIEDLCDPTNQAYTKYSDGKTMPLFIKHPYHIWGFTAILLDLMLSNLLPETYSMKFRRS